MRDPKIRNEDLFSACGMASVAIHKNHYIVEFEYQVGEVFLNEDGLWESAHYLNASDHNDGSVNEVLDNQVELIDAIKGLREIMFSKGVLD
jgi:hypothetical protein